jgi:ribonuclease Z
VWILRSVVQKMNFDNCYQGNLNVYASDASISVLKMLIETLYPTSKKYSDRINYIEVKNNQTVNINDLNVTFFDNKARRDKQFGFFIEDKLVFAGDEPLNEDLFDIAKNKQWLIHESFCLDKDDHIFKSHQKGHCTVKEAAITAEKINAKNLIIVHTEDTDLKNRKENYTKEAKEYFSGNVFVPNDLEVIEL